MHLNTETMPSFAGKNIIPLIVGNVEKSKDVQEQFRALVAYQLMNEQLCKSLLRGVLCAWVGAKARQIAKNYLYENKKGTKGAAARMGTPAFRKTVDKL